MKPGGRGARILYSLGYALLQAWSRTLRFQINDQAGYTDPARVEPFILAIWHNRLLLLPFVVRRFAPHRKPTAIISASRDGAILAEMVRRFGFSSVRGSSSRHGASAVLQLTEVIARGGDVAITPDGPRGPVYRLGDGIIFLAQKSGARVVAANMEFSRAVRLKSWDRFFVPLPFSSVRVTFAEAHPVHVTGSDFEAERMRLEHAMLAIVEEK